MDPTLSILTPTLPRRRDELAKLQECLAPQLDGRCVHRVFEDNGRLTTGEKRDRLLREADTPYVCFVDDDDLVSPDYCARMLTAIDAGADVVGFRLNCYFDGVLEGVAIHSLSCKSWCMDKERGLSLYTRTPNHLNPIRREIATDVGYRALTVGEDADYSRRLFARYGKTMREVFVDAFVYEYFCRTKLPTPIVRWDEFGRLTRAGAEEAIRLGGSAMWLGQSCATVMALDAAEQSCGPA